MPWSGFPSAHRALSIPISNRLFAKIAFKTPVVGDAEQDRFSAHLGSDQGAAEVPLTAPFQAFFSWTPSGLLLGVFLFSLGSLGSCTGREPTRALHPPPLHPPPTHAQLRWQLDDDVTAAACASVLRRGHWPRVTGSSCGSRNGEPNPVRKLKQGSGRLPAANLIVGPKHPQPN